MLRAARLERGDDLYMIAEYLCIKPSFLIALENSRYDEFPADAYVIGFLRTYANFLGLDGKEAIDRYRYEMAGQRHKPVLFMPTPVSEGRAPSIFVLIGAAFAALLIYSLWYAISSPSAPVVPPDLSEAVATTPPKQTPPTSLPSSEPTPLPSKTNVHEEKPAPTPQSLPKESIDKKGAQAKAPMLDEVEEDEEKDILTPPQLALPSVVVYTDGKDGTTSIHVSSEENSKAKNTEDTAKTEETDQKYTNQIISTSRVAIRAVEDSWILIATNDGKTIYDHVLKPGEAYSVPDIPGLLLTTGNGRGIILSLDGQDLPQLATERAQVVRNILLDPDRLSVEEGVSYR